MKKTAVSAVVLAFLIAGASLLHRRPRAEQRQALAQREAATHVLGEYLAGRFPHQQVLIASNPFTQLSGRPREIYQFETAGLDGLRAGFGDKVSYRIAFPELRSGAAENPESVYVDPQTSTPLSFLVADDAFDKLFQANPERHICASLIGLPANLAQTQCWKQHDLKFALLLPDWRLIGNPETIRNAFQSEKIVAAVVNRPDLPPDTKAIDRNYKNTFDRRFLLITPANCDELMNRYRKLF